jgi:hypothetical protein
MHCTFSSKGWMSRCPIRVFLLTTCPLLSINLVSPGPTNITHTNAGRGYQDYAYTDHLSLQKNETLQSAPAVTFAQQQIEFGVLNVSCEGELFKYGSELPVRYFLPYIFVPGNSLQVYTLSTTEKLSERKSPSNLVGVTVVPALS